MHTEIRFASFLSGGFITAIVVNTTEKKLVKRTTVEWLIFGFFHCMNLIHKSWLKFCMFPKNKGLGTNETNSCK